ncbi:MAG: hypothetical protein LCH39_11310 [Proteobacteria bacterium]|nr:hypothetical protein [Pseudomonadota bacterium]
MKLNGLPDLLKFLDFLRSKKIHFRLDQYRSNTITVTFTLVGCRVEVDFFEDHIEFSYFTGDEGVHDDWKLMQSLLEKHWSDD